MVVRIVTFRTSLSIEITAIERRFSSCSDSSVCESACHRAAKCALYSMKSRGARFYPRSGNDLCKRIIAFGLPIQGNPPVAGYGSPRPFSCRQTRKFLMLNWKSFFPPIAAF